MRTPATNRWRYRREPRPVHPDDVGYSALAAVIVMQAVEDYRNASKKIRNAQKIPNENTRKAIISRYKNVQSEIGVFLKGQCYGILCDIDPEIILRKLRSEE